MGHTTLHVGNVTAGAVAAGASDAARALDVAKQWPIERELNMVPAWIGCFPSLGLERTSINTLATFLDRTVDCRCGT
jgi:hypothetical protein